MFVLKETLYHTFFQTFFQELTFSAYAQDTKVKYWATVHCRHNLVFVTCYTRTTGLRNYVDEKIAAVSWK